MMCRRSGGFRSCWSRRLHRRFRRGGGVGLDVGDPAGEDRRGVDLSVDAGDVAGSGCETEVR